MTLHTINAGGFSAVADAFATDEDDGLWFLSMVGSQTGANVKSGVWGALGGALCELDAVAKLHSGDQFAELLEPPDPVPTTLGAQRELVGECQH